MTQQILNQLVAMSNCIGRPELDSPSWARATPRPAPTPARFYVKASGHELRTITAAGFVHVAFEPRAANCWIAATSPTRRSKRA